MPSASHAQSSRNVLAGAAVVEDLVPRDERGGHVEAEGIFAGDGRGEADGVGAGEGGATSVGLDERVGVGEGETDAASRRGAQPEVGGGAEVRRVLHRHDGDADLLGAVDGVIHGGGAGVMAEAVVGVEDGGAGGRLRDGEGRRRVDAPGLDDTAIVWEQLNAMRVDAAERRLDERVDDVLDRGGADAARGQHATHDRRQWCSVSRSHRSISIPSRAPSCG